MMNWPTGTEQPGQTINLPSTALNTLPKVQELLTKKYLPEIHKLLKIAEAQDVKDDLSEKTAIDMASQAKTLTKRLEDQRKETIKEQDTFVRGVNSMCKGFRDQLDKIETILKQKIGQFQWKKELDRREREKMAQEEADKLKKQIEAEAKKAGVDPPPLDVVVPIEKKQTVTRTESGASSHIRMDWKFEIEDIDKVPRDYMVLDEQKVKAAIKAGIRAIPGLIIKELPTTVIR